MFENEEEAANDWAREWSESTSGNLAWNFFETHTKFVCNAVLLFFWYAELYLPYIYYTHLHASHIQWTRRNENEAKWQPMSSIFCCLDRIYITLTRTRHKLDHTNQLTAIHIHYVRLVLLLSLIFFNISLFVHRFVLWWAIFSFGHIARIDHEPNTNMLLICSLSSELG